MSESFSSMESRRYKKCSKTLVAWKASVTRSVPFVVNEGYLLARTFLYFERYKITELIYEKSTRLLKLFRRKTCLDQINIWLGWLICCCTSTCCAGLLCSVLCARFLDVPAVLQLSDLQSEETLYEHVPLVAVCPPVDASAAKLADILTTNATLAEDARESLAQILAAKPTSVHRLQLLEILLLAKNISFSELISENMPPCDQLMLKCRWQDMVVPCKILFTKELTPWGVCCVMRPAKALNAIIQPRDSRYKMTNELDLALQCSDDPTQGCRFFSTFEADETVEPAVIFPGYNYFAQLQFKSVPQNSVEEIVGVACNANMDYIKANCLAHCAEKACGCTNPLRPKKDLIQKKILPCTVTQLECLRVYKNSLKCNCLPCCNKVTSNVALQSGRMYVLNSALDPIYSKLNGTSTVLHLRVYISLSRIFTMNPTETWLSLLCSLGGVFNMFLGVGLFSALEILFLLLVKLPIAFKTSSEITSPPLSRY